MSIHVSPSAVPTVLCELMGKYKSDKGNAENTARHNYTRYYDALFGPERTQVTRMFELGIFGGSSLRAWRDYFPNATIYGADIDSGSVGCVHGEPRIVSYQCDETNADQVADMWARHARTEPALFDIILDDGLHTPEANSFFLDRAWHMLKPGGIYIIEDITSDSHVSAILGWHGPPYETETHYLKIPHLEDTSDNALLIFEKPCP